MNNKDTILKKAIKRAEMGGFREYWLQLYIKNNYKRLGFDNLKGPFESGYDFEGVYKGKKVVIEAETQSRNFIYHRHDSNEVDILIVLNDDTTDEVLGMPPTEWRKCLPKKIIVVDPEDFVKSTHEIRKNYAVKKQKENKLFLEILPFISIKGAFATLWNLLVEETPYEDKGTPETDAFDEALYLTAIEYIKFYNLDLEKLRKGSVFTRIEVLANDLIKSKRGFNDLTSEEKNFLEDWLEVLGAKYASRI